MDTGVSARAQELTQREFQRRQQSSARGTVGENSVRETVAQREHDIRERSRVEILADMVLAATNEALRMAQELAARKLGGATGGLDLGGLGGLGMPGL